MDAATLKQFESDLKDVHLVYAYNVRTPSGQQENWKYEAWFLNENRVVYKIHGGPMAGRSNYQTCSFQCIRPGELWQCNWLEETGTIVSLVYDIPRRKITTLIAFSKGHWEHPDQAHGDKRNPEDFKRWRELAKIGIQNDRKLIQSQADIAEVFHGAGELSPIDPDGPTI
eukprot:Protomagalhaensia_wolfi_Nauph_80__6133@NODE_888_length_1908_cov_279_346709_g667_i0_p2_GENE_NODE_888_length_1908_cov_279_346709_g667_i0NODE_888_length_1908_cov_279_346709_g667_i0_p2_ORF_typecomplete_len170_score30_13PA_decarbox/PF05870_11/2_6e48MoaF_C/PF17409_2/1_4e05MoaF/PF10703_9/0_0031_NODE_888_length_1908_cov_279_346709_g667_i012571766